MARKELRASTEETRESVTRMLRKKVKTMRSEEGGIYVEGFLPFSLMEEVVELLRTDKKFQRIAGVARIQVKDHNDINEKAHKLGIHFCPGVTYAVARNEHSGRWLGSISIGEMYYETDPYKDKDGAVSESLGCLEALKEKTEQVINKLYIYNTNMKKGIELIAEERQRQIEIEGYSAQHDSQHNASEFIYAAIAYVESAKVGVNCAEMGNTDEHEIMRRKTEMGRYYPFGRSFKPSTDIRDLVKAGALIAAAIDRLESTGI